MQAMDEEGLVILFVYQDQKFFDALGGGYIKRSERNRDILQTDRLYENPFGFYCGSFFSKIDDCCYSLLLEKIETFFRRLTAAKNLIGH